MNSALFYLQACSFWNRLVTRIQRLKQPKYLLGLCVGGLWLYFTFFHAASRGSRRAQGMTAVDFTEFLPALELLAALALLVVVLGGWILGQERAALAFTEAETVFLFPAPIARRTLLHFKLLKSQFGILITTFFMMILSTQFGARDRPWAIFIGWWVVLSFLNLHFLGSSFARTRLLDRGLTHARRRLVILALVALAVGAVFFWARDTMRLPTETEMEDWRKMLRWFHAMLETGPAPWLLWPFRLVVRPYLAESGGALLAALWPALLLLIAHYVWVMHSNVAFEEASLALAEKRAKLVSAAKQGQMMPVSHKARRGPFELKAQGPAAVAFLWKNWIGAGNMLRGRAMFTLILVLGVVLFSVGFNERRGGLGMMAGMILMMLLIWSLMLGPMFLRQDFRSDLKSMDMLKLYPLAGWRVVLGELLAPALLLTVAQWALLLAGVFLVNGPKGNEVGPVERLSVAAAAALTLPMLNVISFLIPNASVLLFPAWFQTGQDATQGLEAMGQRLILGLGQFFAFLVALTPAAIAFLVVFFVARVALPWPVAVPLAALPAAMVLAAEAALGVGLLGKVFEKFDVSAEPQN